MSAIPYVPGLPGLRAAKTSRHRHVFKGGYTPGLLPGGKRLSGLYSRDPLNTDTVTNLQAGLILGLRTADSYYAPSIIGVTTNAEAVGSVAIEASAAVVTELVRRVGSSGTFKLTGPPTANGVVVTETVTYSSAATTIIVCTAIVNAYVAGSFIQPTDGSETPITFIPDSHGIPVTEPDGTAVTVLELPGLPIDGVVDSSQLLNWPSDTSLQTWLVNRLGYYGKFVWDHLY